MKKQSVIMLMGDPVTGKTTSAQRLYFQFLDLRPDVELLTTLSIRESLGLMEDLHSDKARERVYDEIAKFTGKKLDEGKEILILDGNFNKRSRREKIYNIAHKNNASLIIIECKVKKEKIIKERLSFRQKNTDAIQHKADSIELYKMIKNSSDSVIGDTLPNGKPVKIVEYFTEEQQVSLLNCEDVNENEKQLIDETINYLVPKKEKKSDLQAIIFDIGGVIQPLRWECVSNQLMQLNKNISMDHFRTALYMNKEQWFGLYEVSRISSIDFWEEMARRLEISTKHIDLVSEAFSNLYGPVDPDIESIVNRLKSCGYKVFILSNNCPELEKNIERNKTFYTQFEKIYLSHKIGFKKPDKRSFQIILDENRLRADECIFIDDVTRNINTAEDLGMLAVLFLYPNKLEQNLKQILPYFE